MANLVVTDSGDSGPGTLRGQIAAANPGDTITFDAGLTGRTLTLQSTLLVNKAVTIDGSGVDLKISGNDSVGDFDVNFTTTGTATLENLTIDDGHDAGAMGTMGANGANGGNGGDAAGGILFQNGSLNLVNDTFDDDSGEGGRGGTGGTGGNGGNGGNAAGAVYVEPGTAITASNLNGQGLSAGTAAGNAGAGGSQGGFGTIDPYSNSAVVSAAFCFLTGTRIGTLRGEVPIEALQAGDMAVTASGALRPVVWIGHREVDCAQGGVPEVSPVRIRAGAFGSGLPERDLYLSPGHPVLVGEGVDEVLVPIMCLINGTTIARIRLDRFIYWHVELDAHDILLAEGLPAESFLDYGSRAWFGEGADRALTDPDFVAPGLGGRCRPVAIDGPIVEAERRRLDALFAMSLDAPCAWPDDAATTLGL